MHINNFNSFLTTWTLIYEKISVYLWSNSTSVCTVFSLLGHTSVGGSNGMSTRNDIHVCIIIK